MDAIQCRSNALLHNQCPLPVASITDEIKPYDPRLAHDPYDLSVEADFFYIDAEEPLDNPLEALPHMGPKWYWCENALAIMHFGYSKRGKVDQSHVTMTFTASSHAPADSFVQPYKEIEQIVQATMEGRTNPRPWPVGEAHEKHFSHPRPYTEEEIRKQSKNLILAMQGAWTSQHHRSWECVNSQYEEHCPGPVHMWRRNTDGTKRLMTRTDMLTNRTMLLIGRIPLDMEHYLLWKLHYRLKQIPRAPSVHGCINDCLYLRATPPHKCQCYLCTSGEGPCEKMNQKIIEAEDQINLHVNHNQQH